MKRPSKMTEEETMQLIRHYGDRISRAGTGIPRTTRCDILEWVRRVTELTNSMPKKNSQYLSDE